MTEFHIQAATPPILAGSAFSNSASSKTFFIPVGSLSTYQSSWGSWYTFVEEETLLFNLTINTNDSTWGTGSYSALSDSIAKITAVPYYGYHFDHWSFGSTSNPDTIMLTEDATITAIFAKNQYSLSVNVNIDSSGSVSLPLGNTAYYLDTLTAIAHPNAHYHFKKWKTVGSVSEDVDYSNLSLNDFTQMSADSTNPAGGNTFRYIVTTSITNTISWFCYYWFESLDGSMEWQFTPRCTGRQAIGYGHEILECNYNDLFTNTTIGNTITYSGLGGIKITYSNIGWVIEFPVEVRCVHRQTNASYTTVYWSTGETVLAETDTVDIVMDKNKDILCVFVPDTHYVSALTSDSTRGLAVSSGTSVAYGEHCTIQATANYGYHFDHWSDGETNNPRTVMITHDTVIVALFAKNQYNVTGATNDSIKGIVTGSATVDYLDTVTLTATANYGYQFIRWSDYQIENPRKIAATADITKTAIFDLNQFNLTVQADTSIHGTCTGGGIYNYMSEHTILATANYGYHFDHWSDGDTNNPRVVTLTQDTTLIAYFAPNQYNVSLESNDAALGSVQGNGIYNYLDTITISANAIEHYHLVHWNDGNTDNPRQIVVTCDTSFTAHFAIDTHTVNVVTSDIARGMVETTGTEFVYGTPCTVTATAYTGYTFAGWSNGVTSNPYTFAVLSDVELTALFIAEGEEVYTVNVESANPTMGTVSGGGQAFDGGSVVIRAAGNPGYHFTQWNDGNTDSVRTVVVHGNVTYTAYFASDNGTEGIDEPQNRDDIQVLARNHSICISGACGQRVYVYGIDGRMVATRRNATEQVSIPVPTTGVYFVKVGNLPARKVVVIR